MIVRFRHKGLETFHRTGSTKGITTAHATKLRRILTALEATSEPAEMNLPGYRMHPLKGKRKKHWSVWVSGNWRVTFRFEGTDLNEVDYLDYH